jgi:DNA-binding CsgD family transcriptional regulator
MVNRHLDVLEFASHTSQYHDLKTLTDAFVRLMGRFGFSSFIFTGLPRVGYNVASLIICDYWPEGWTDRYRDQNYFAEDPVGRWSIMKRRPFRWRDAQRAEAQTPIRQQIAGEAWEHGLADGIAYPLQGETSAVVSLASEGNLSIDPMDEASIFLAVSYFKTCAEDISRAAVKPVRPVLTFREIEHLKWMVEGKTVWETSCILSISASTVKLHRASIRQKLGVASTTQAATIAVQRGIIPL